jgi:predicted Rossmann fold nucleotide-binding protein DprA/Smf involved in DNA uptake
LTVEDLGKYLPSDTTEIVSGGAKGVDTSAREYAQAHGIKLTEFLPDYKTYGKTAPLKRNLAIIAHAQTVLAFWDGESRGTKYVIDNCREVGVPVKVLMSDDKGGFEVWRRFAVEDLFVLLLAVTGYFLWFLDIV